MAQHQHQKEKAKICLLKSPPEKHKSYIPFSTTRSQNEGEERQQQRGRGATALERRTGSIVVMAGGTELWDLQRPPVNYWRCQQEEYIKGTGKKGKGGMKQHNLAINGTHE